MDAINVTQQAVTETGFFFERERVTETGGQVGTALPHWIMIHESMIKGVSQFNVANGPTS